ncbi:MAG: SET domain-containing protein-lysine N-methyltransferase, partial [Candidatus Pacearchaeota archaeon]|nr:SET domain-containing protein-lysine N-methyltransferase [Candidatus Pacearchaeota archaeon]
LHNRWSHRWITPKAESFNSQIHGIGIRAKEDISKGEIIGIIGGIVVPVSEIKEYWKEMGHLGVQVDNNFYIVPPTREGLGEIGAINHSCNPNMGFAGDVRLIAIKNIKKNEEITADYGMCYSSLESFECNCKSLNCRKKITQDDWKILELQKKYGKYFAPYLREKF